MVSTKPLAECTLVEAALRCVYLRALSSTNSVATLRRGARVTPPAVSGRPPPPSFTTRLTRAPPHHQGAAHSQPPRQGGADRRDRRAVGEGRHTRGVRPRPRREARGSPGQAREVRPTVFRFSTRSVTKPRADSRPRDDSAVAGASAPSFSSQSSRDERKTENVRSPIPRIAFAFAPPQRRPRDAGRAEQSPAAGQGRHA